MEEERSWLEEGLGTGVWELQEAQVAGRTGEGMEIVEKTLLERREGCGVEEELVGGSLTAG
jgi:hypothetical protein